MSSYNKDKFLKEVLSYIKFPFDRESIKEELSDHLDDRIDYYIENGINLEEAENKAISNMGDAKGIGIELNKEHNPIIGWILKLTTITTAIIIIVFIYIFLGSFLVSMFNIDTISKENIDYIIKVDRQVQLDDKVITITELVFETNGDVNIIYQYYKPNIFRPNWNSPEIGNIYDDFGNTYRLNNNGKRNNGYLVTVMQSINSFSSDATILIIDYDMYNRNYRIEIPIKQGENND